MPSIEPAELVEVDKAGMSRNVSTTSELPVWVNSSALIEVIGAGEPILGSRLIREPVTIMAPSSLAPWSAPASCACATKGTELTASNNPARVVIFAKPMIIPVI